MVSYMKPKLDAAKLVVLQKTSLDLNSLPLQAHHEPPSPRLFSSASFGNPSRRSRAFAGALWLEYFSVCKLLRLFFAGQALPGGGHRA